MISVEHIMTTRQEYGKAGKDRILTGTSKSISTPVKSQMKLILAYVMSQITDIKKELADIEKEKMEERLKGLDIKVIKT